MNLFKEIQLAQKQLAAVIVPTPLIENLSLSKQYSAAVLLKREDLQAGYSFKIREFIIKLILCLLLRKSAELFVPATEIMHRELPTAVSY